MKYRTRRKPTDYEVVLWVGDDRASVTVLNVSDRGMRVSQDGVLLVPDEQVELDIRGRRFPTLVSWSKEREAGLEFERPLPPDVLAMISRSKMSGKRGRFLPGH